MEYLHTDKNVDYGKLLFLDVDGVLNTPKTRNRSSGGYIGVGTKQLLILSDIVKETEAKIILSSSWKFCWQWNGGLDPDMDAKYLMKRLKQFGLEIYDFSWDSGFNREMGVQRYLEIHPNHSGYVIIDDEPFLFEAWGMKKHLVLTDPATGLTFEDAGRAEQILLSDLPEYEPVTKEEKEKQINSHFGRELIW